MSDMRWADSTDDEDDDFNGDHVSASADGLESTEMLQVSAKVLEPINKEKPISVATGRFDIGDDDDHADDEGSEDEGEEDKDEAAERERQRRLEEARKIAKQKEEEMRSSQKINIDDQLHDLDDILNEFGIEAEEEKESKNENENGENAKEADEPTTAGGSKRRRRKKKSKAATGDEPSAPEATVGEVDVAAVLKAKTKKKGKTPAEIAAATAAKEVKAKKEAEGKKKKKNKKDTFGR
mmetsp:Transcript_20957/g.31045  ORF Transcript_20957/g.31045 Transcript_20957/m.31045 type:complete len:238 (-) Transcript_20957:121-834(-)|eukprot:CAMPEP_0194216904 /NCGR_PEP_ID=MMETSP0156-20130528/19952_1 /TAXON_ID=33649 /ORGANISM="Thalassionema nitzschioides, Strain L26-B" /LENGTH=237 /DNA_ID=CAMNT_0038945787 /DNA_START=144 /DNA_END=857 /DNA_ORIENTATION=+